MNRGVLALWSLTDVLQPFVTIAVAVLVTHWLTVWLGWRWIWQYVTAIVVWSTLNWAVELLLNSLGQRL
ncbi:MAG TPA: hypothetical protein VKB67_06950 [Rhizomicrobium sp.]|nr:hypothetical protein [Rhizomicrobium sp.]